MNILKNNNIKWIHIVEPKKEDIEWLKKEFDINPIIANEIEKPSIKSQVEIFDKNLFFVSYSPFYEQKDEYSTKLEIDFIITKNVVITIQYEKSKNIFNDFDGQNALNTLNLTHNIIEHITTFEERQLRHIREKIEFAGKELFNNKEEEIFKKLTRLKRDVSEYRMIVRFQEPALKLLALKGKKFWGDDSQIYLENLIENHKNIINQLEDCREAISDFEYTNNQLMNTKVNKTMKTLTALSFMTFPFMLVASIFSMRTIDTPIINEPGGFFIIIGFIVIGMIIIGIYFKNKKWF